MWPCDAGAAAEERSKAKRTQMACRKSPQRRRKWVLPRGEALPGQTGPTPGRQGGRSTHRSQQKICYRPGGSYTACHPPPKYHRLLTISAQIPHPQNILSVSLKHPHRNPLKTLQYAALDPQPLKSLSHLVTLLPVTMLPRLSKSEKNL